MSLLDAPPRITQFPLGEDDLSRRRVLPSAPEAAACQICFLVRLKQLSCGLSSRRVRREKHVLSLGAAYSLVRFLTE